ncbi:MAG: hypothetical protein E8D47_03640 [Nitrospira sp.]|nr:MAG: hypothetical protein E8D47_03640 [Nitrospira sp.]
MMPQAPMSRKASGPFRQASQAAAFTITDEFKWSSASTPSPGPLFYLDQVVQTHGQTLGSNTSTIGDTVKRNGSAEDFSHAEPPLVFPKALPIQEDHFRSLQSWEGVVETATSEGFTARLWDRAKKSPDQIAEFPIEEVSTADRDLVQPGAIFYWDIGYSEDKTGQRMRASLIRLRRLPAWTRKEIEKAIHDSAEMRNKLGWE